VENMEKVIISDNREIHIQISQFKHRKTLDIRTYVKTPSYTGYTPKGINIPIEKGKELAESILKVIGGINK